MARWENRPGSESQTEGPAWRLPEVEDFMNKSGFLTFKGSTITKGQVIDLVVLDCSKLWRIWTPENQEKGAALALTKHVLNTRVP